MGGEGSMSHAAVSTRENRALLKKRRSFREIRKNYVKFSGGEKADFKKVSPEELAVIREKIRIQYRKEVQREVVIYIISIVLVIGFLYFLYLWIFE